MKTNTLSILFLSTLIAVSSIYATGWDIQLGGQVFTNFSPPSNTDRTLDPSRTPNLSDNIAGWIPRLTIFYRYSDIPTDKNTEDCWSWYGSVNQDVINHTIVSTGLARKITRRFSEGGFSFYKTTLGLGIGNTYRYIYQYNQQPSDYFNEYEYLAPQIIYSLGVGVYLGTTPVSIQYGGIVSMPEIFHLYNGSLLQNSGQGSTISSDNWPASMATLSLEIGL